MGGNDFRRDVDADAVERGVGVDALLAPVKGRKFDALPEEALSGSRVVALFNRAVVFLDRAVENGGLDVPAGRHFVDGMGLLHDAVDELDAERRPLEGAVVGDHPAALFGKRQDRV